jgi:acetyltransferase-like isoleucine patch superfamily enzyme
LYVEKDAIISIKEQGQISIGSYFYINHFSIIDCYYQITIGNRVQIGPHCYITDFDHDLVVDLNRAFHRGDKKLAAVIIEDNVWIGAHVTILKGVTIGKNAVIAAGSVVTKNVAPNTVVAGVPAVFKKEILYSNNANT